MGAAALGALVPDPAPAEPVPDRAPDPAEPVPVPVDPAALDLSAAARIARMMHEPRTVNILVTNHGTDPVPIRQVELRTESFAPTGPATKDLVIPAGAARALAVIYGEARCHGQAAPPLAPGTVILTLAADPPATVELSLPDQDDELLLLLGRECAAQRATGAVEIRFGSWAAAADGTLIGELVLERRDGAEPVVLDAVSGNVLFDVDAESADPDGPLGALAPAEDRLAVPVIADTNRCDGHAVGEAKQRFLLRVWVSVGADTQLPVAVELDPADHERFEEMQRIRCDL